MWDAATSGTQEANHRQKEAHAELMRFWSDKVRYEIARRLNEAGDITDPISARTNKRIYLSAAKAQQDDDTIDKFARLMAEIRHNYYNFRAGDE